MKGGEGRNFNASGAELLAQSFQFQAPSILLGMLQDRWVGCWEGAASVDPSSYVLHMLSELKKITSTVLKGGNVTKP